MTSDPNELLQQAITLARSGEKAAARQMLVEVLKANPGSETAWLWMSAVVDRPNERVHCLRQVLAINPHNEMALKGLKALEQISPAAGAPSSPAGAASRPVGEPAAGASYTDQPPGTHQPDLPPAPDGVPLMDQGRIAGLQRMADEILESIQAERALPEPAIRWSMPGELRRRPRALAALRPSPLMLAIAGAVLVVAAVVVLVSSLLNTVRARQIAASVTPVAPPTQTAIPQPTLTPRPTRTPPPDDRAVAEPTIPPADAPRGDVRFGITPTPPYINTPHPANPSMQAALEAFHRGDYQTALELVNQTRAGGYDPVDAYYVEAVSRINLGDLDGASAAARSGLSRAPDFAPLHVAQGLIYSQQGAAARARQSFQRARDLDPRLVAAYLGLAESYLAQGDAEAALEQAEAARSARKYDVGVLAMMSRAYLAAGDPDNAAAYANLAYYVDPASEQSVLALGHARLALGLDLRAVMVLEDYVYDVNPASAEAWGLLGQAYGRQGRIEEAQQAFSRALQLSDSVTSALAGRGDFYFRQGQYQLAYEDLTAAIEASPNPDPELRHLRARTALMLGEPALALDDLMILREQRPDDPAIATFYVRMLVEAGRYREVSQAVEAALALEPSSEEQGYLHEALARALFEQGEYEEAQAEIDRALAVARTGTRLYTRALIAVELGDTAQAIRDLEWLLFWDRVYAYPFATDLQPRLATLREAAAVEP